MIVQQVGERLLVRASNEQSPRFDRSLSVCCRARCMLEIIAHWRREREATRWFVGREGNLHRCSVWLCIDVLDVDARLLRRCIVVELLVVLVKQAELDERALDHGAHVLSLLGATLARHQVVWIDTSKELEQGSFAWQLMQWQHLQST